MDGLETPPTQEAWYDQTDIAKGMEPMAIPVEVPVGRHYSMNKFTYVQESVMSKSAVVDEGRETPCKCVGSDCGDAAADCECIAKNGGGAPYTVDGRLTDILRVGGREVRTPKLSLAYFHRNSWFI